MLMLTGEYEHSIDDKNRIFVTSKLRSQIDTETYGSCFFLVMGANGILCMYPEKYFKQVVLAGAPRMAGPDEVVAFERLSFALASRVELDRQGRLLLNDKLRRRAKLGTNLTLVGVRDHIELWNTEQWENYLMDKLSPYKQQMTQARATVLQQENPDIDL